MAATPWGVTPRQLAALAFGFLRVRRFVRGDRQGMASALMESVVSNTPPDTLENNTMELPNRIMKGLSHIELEDVLDRVGLQRKTSISSKVIPAVGLLLGGIGIGLLLAPKAGKDTRKSLIKGAKEIAESAQEMRETGMQIFAAEEGSNHHVKKAAARG